MQKLKPLTRCLQFLLILFFWGPFSTGADRIILKDGTIETSDRVWESERYVHFILQGTRSVEIRYAKEIVARIEGSDGSHTKRIKAPVRPDKPAKAPSIDSRLPSRQETVRNKIDSEKPQRPSAKQLNIDRRVIESNRGVKFFDPRRPHKYWAARNSKHDSVSAAINALAKIYNQPPAWIEAHMGGENDLGVIHANLIEAYHNVHEAPPAGNENKSKVNESALKEGGVRNTDEPEGSANGMELEGAALNNGPAERNREPQAPDKTTAVGEVKPSGNTATRAPVSGEDHYNANFPDIPEGISFYDPRRPEKYWVDGTHHFNTLDDAVRQLSVLYGVSQEWISDHLGNSNELYEIHLSIRESLRSERSE